MLQYQTTKIVKVAKLSTILIIFIWAILLVIRLILSSYIVYNDTKSEPLGLYTIHNLENVELNKIYMVKIPNEYLDIAKKLGYVGDGYFLKRVVAKSGDTITIVATGVMINNQLVPQSKALINAKNIQLNPLPIGWKHTLSNDEFWTLGNGEHSFDSRYYGVITRQNIIKQANFLYYNKGIELWQKLSHP